ncbi:MAG: hypothetical protein KDD20_04455 [Mangrovimonas sp.]|nr:hypothetical protein [Mangrovimonas sp.]
MKKIYIILFTVFLNMAFTSCTPTAVNEEAVQSDDCCGGTGGIPPPPPPYGGG